MDEAYEQFYDLEKYLFETVSPDFKRTGKLSTFNFFCIVIWKANRAKSKISNRLLDNSSRGLKSRHKRDLDDAVARLVSEIVTEEREDKKLGVLIARGFRLPMASAILTVLYPDKYTVFDERVCRELGDFGDATNKTAIKSIWARYSSYMETVRTKAPSYCKSLREKDLYLWGKSFATDLKRDIETGFSKSIHISSNGEPQE
jgi:hypothetical protein